jgi:hypothetical protein
LPLGRVSLSPHYHLSLLVSHHTSLCCSCLHYVSRQRNFFSGKEWFFFKREKQLFLI